MPKFKISVNGKFVGFEIEMMEATAIQQFLSSNSVEQGAIVQADYVHPSTRTYQFDIFYMEDEYLGEVEALTSGDAEEAYAFHNDVETNEIFAYSTENTEDIEDYLK